MSIPKDRKTRPKKLTAKEREQIARAEGIWRRKRHLTKKPKQKKPQQ